MQVFFIYIFQVLKTWKVYVLISNHFQSPSAHLQSPRNNKKERKNHFTFNLKRKKVLINGFFYK